MAKLNSWQEVFAALKPVISDKLFVDDEDTITPEASFKDDLNADSLGMVELVMEIGDVSKGWTDTGKELELSDEVVGSIRTVRDAANVICDELDIEYSSDEQPVAA